MLEEMREQDLHFFHRVGRCIMKYQNIEDYLKDVFITTSKMPILIAERIFDTVQGLERKLELITITVDQFEERRQFEWSALRQQIRQSAQSRNLIAHGCPAYGGQTITFMTDGNTEVSGIPHFTLRKRTKEGETVFDLEQLDGMLRDFQKLFGFLICFVYFLDGKGPPSHLLESYPSL